MSGFRQSGRVSHAAGASNIYHPGGQIAVNRLRTVRKSGKLLHIGANLTTSLRTITVPTLIKFLTVCAVLGGIVFGSLFALAEFVEPQEREMSHRVPKAHLLD